MNTGGRQKKPKSNGPVRYVLSPPPPIRQKPYFWGDFPHCLHLHLVNRAVN